MREKRADLHLHTTCSDGELTPAQLVQKAARRGLQLIAVTDHDTVDGFEEATGTGARIGVTVISGVELSVHVDSREIHLLGYFFDPKHERLLQQLAQFREQRSDRARSIVERLNGVGIPLTFEAVLAQARGEALGRPHVAAALESAGHVADRQEAFQRFLGPAGAAYVPKPEFPARKALSLLHEAGGIGVLAHPGHWTPDAVVSTLVKEGLDGIETVHPSHQPWITAYYERLAERYGLVQTGGSDYHGSRPKDEENIGTFTISLSQVETIRARAA
ncbi:MAG TPA: PHP domain-containing protein [Rhodothermales bacterium]|nr:PHP domain-containing protein [Rhodothermales bacterium]